VLEDTWNSILEFTSKFVIPDWEATIRLIPIVLLIVIAIWLILTVRKFATAGPTRRGKARITPLPPSDVHMPGPSWAPFLAAAGAFLTFFGLVVGGVALWIGLAALVLTLLYWGREALRDYDAIGHHDGAALLPAPVHAGPPPGVHMPGPSFRPFIGALGVAVLFFGLVFGGWLLAVGIILTIVTLLGWLVDARREYVHTLEADRTGHLAPLPDPAWPRRLLWVGGLMIALALLADNGVFPPRTPEQTAAGGGGAPAPASQPPASGETPASQAPGGEPGPSLPEADTVITAQAVQFTTQQVEVAGPDFTIAFDNRDSGTPHDVDIRDEGDAVVFDGQIFPGPEARVYEVTGIEPGSYEFFCSVHINMTGTITVN
jgi:plastocyanin